MGWTDENYSEPQGNWGQASVNDVGWGQSAVNAISWGMAHVLSWGHAITNLLGKLGIPTDNLNWSDWLGDYTPESVNSGVGLDCISGNGDFVQFNETVTLIGDFTAKFTLRINNGSRFIGLANGGQYIRTTNLGGKLHVVFQLGGFINVPTLKDWVANDIVNVTVTRVGNEYTATTEEGTGATVTGSTNNLRYDYLYRTGGIYWTGATYFIQIIASNLSFTLDFLQSSGSTIYSREYATTGIYGTVYGADWITGSPHGEQLYKWGFNRYTTGGVLDNDNGTVYITGDSKDATTDVLGNAIALPAFEFVDNAPIASNHYSQLEDVANAINTSGDLTVCLWLSVTDYGDGGQVLTNGALTIAIDATNIEFSRDGVTTATYAHNSTDFIYAVFVSGSGVTDIWIGDVNNAPTKVSTAVACGTSTAATYPMHKNNNQALSDRFNGYNGVAAIYNELSDDSVIQDVYTTTQSDIS